MFPRRTVIQSPKVALPPKKKPIVLRNEQSPGDIVALTAAVRDLYRAHSNSFEIQVHTTCNELWQNNPYVRVVKDRNEYLRGSEEVLCQYPAIHRSNQRPIHFIQAFHEDLERRLGLRIPVSAFKGDLHLSREEKSWPTELLGEDLDPNKPWWLMLAGGKFDFTTKWWDPGFYQEVVDGLQGKVQFVQCGQADHWHPPLKNVINLIGKTSLRQFLRMVYHAYGIVCPITFAMHAAAAVETPERRMRPCVVIAGGREPVHWEQYPGHQFLHTIGILDCCATGGCWKNRCQKVGDGDLKDARELCKYPVDISNDLQIPKCMKMITPQEVIGAVERYVDHFPHQSNDLAIKHSAGKGKKEGLDETDANQKRHLGAFVNRTTSEHLNEDTARQALDRAMTTLPRYPDAYQGRGIVIPGGGKEYFTNAWVCINMLRHHGCTLPIELWYLGDKEVTHSMRRMVDSLDVRCVDAEKIRNRLPCRILAGFEVKVYALVHCAFEEILFLDADNFPLANPSYLFESEEYQQTGAIFWPDRGRTTPDQQIWDLTGIPYRNEPEFETGQIVLDKQRCWKELQLTLWFNEHSDFWYHHVYGDKDTFRFAWHKFETKFSMIPHRLRDICGVMCQHDFQGQRLFQHRSGQKWSLEGEFNPIAGLEQEELGFSYLEELKRLWADTKRAGVVSTA